MTTDAGDLAECDIVVEAIAEELDAKAELFRGARRARRPTRSSRRRPPRSRSRAIAEASGTGGRLFGLHPFNPVVRMELIELCVPEGADESIAARARAWCESIGKTVVDVPDEAGFVVNRLLFPYLFDAVRLLEQTGMKPEEVDRCMTLGRRTTRWARWRCWTSSGSTSPRRSATRCTPRPRSPTTARPAGSIALTGEGKLGRKSGEGFYRYD